MQRWLNRVWYEGAPGALLLLPLAWLFALGAGLRRGAFRHGVVESQHVGGRVIVVGNLTAGGTGKTPLVIWLVEQLRGRGLNVGVVLRGYGGAAGAARLLAADATAAQVGDEALLIRRRTGCAVAVGRDRVAAARLLRGAGIDYIVSDDGLQHYRLARDAEIVVIDAARGFGNGRLLPAGPLREPPTRLRTASAVVVNGGASAFYEHGIGMQLLPEHIVPLDEYARGAPQPGAAPLASWRGRRVHAVAGIGRPQRFFEMLRAQGLEVLGHEFPDHHVYRAAELDFGDQLPVLITEKDAVKCTRFALRGLWVVPVSAQLDAQPARELIARLAGA